MAEGNFVEPTTGGGAGYDRSLKRFEGVINLANAEEAMAESFGNSSAKEFVKTLQGLASRQSLNYTIILKAALGVLEAEYESLTVEPDDDETDDELN